MELLGERPVWSMSGSEMLSTLDALDAELARLQTYRLHVIAGLEDDRLRRGDRCPRHRPPAHVPATASTAARPTATSAWPGPSRSTPPSSAALPDTDQPAALARRRLWPTTWRGTDADARTAEAARGSLRPAQAEAIVCRAGPGPCQGHGRPSRGRRRTTGRSGRTPVARTAAQSRQGDPRPARHRRPRTRRAQGLRPRIPDPDQRRQRREVPRLPGQRERRTPPRPHPRRRQTPQDPRRRT